MKDETGGIDLWLEIEAEDNPTLSFFKKGEVEDSILIQDFNSIMELIDFNTAWKGFFNSI